MNEIPLHNNISKSYLRDFERERKSYPYCQCGYQINIKILKMDLKIIYYGICEKCKRLNFFKEFTELNQGKFQQTWQRIQKNDIKREFEEFLLITIPDNDLENYSVSFDEIIHKIRLLNEIKQLIKISVIKQS